MVICPKCDFANPDDANLCSRCGNARYINAAAVAVLEPASDSVAPFDRTPMPAQPSLTLSIRPVSRIAYSDATPSVPTPATVVDQPLAQLPEPPSELTLQNRAAGMNSRADSPATITADPGPATATTPSVPPDSAPAIPEINVKLVVLRGLKIGVEYPIYPGRNTLGRFVDKPVDVDLLAQESVEQTWCSRVHAAVMLDKSVVMIEDLNSLNGTWINGTRIHPGQHRVLQANDVVQIGTVQMKLVVGTA